VQIMRDGELKQLRVTVKEASDSAQVADNKLQNSKEDGSLNGVAVADLDPQTRREFNIPKSVNGAVITEVDPGSAAAEAGLKPGYVILEINKHPVKSADDAVHLTEKASPKTFLRVYGEHGSHYLVVDESSNKNG